MADFLFFVIFVTAVFFIGQHIQKKHFVSLDNRERALLHLPAVVGRKVFNDEDVEKAWLVHGTVVVSGDYFKMMLAGLIKFFGGRISAYESLLDRSRREALLRMKESAASDGAHMVVNVRFETSKIDGGNPSQQTTGMFEMLAYGTAIRLKAQ